MNFNVREEPRIGRNLFDLHNQGLSKYKDHLEKLQDSENFSILPLVAKKQKFRVVWDALCQKHYGESNKGIWSQADKGKVIHIINYLPDDACEVIKKVLPLWHEYSSYVKENKGLKKVPEKPSIGFLLVNLHFALSFLFDFESSLDKTVEKSVVPEKPVNYKNDLYVLE